MSKAARSVVTARARELVAALRATPAIERFRAAEERFQTDTELARMQAGLRWSQERLQQAKLEIRHDPRLFREVRDAQAQFQKHPVVVEFVAARAAAQDLLRRTNAAMTEVLGVDVGASAGRAGGCC